MRKLISASALALALAACSDRDPSPREVGDQEVTDLNRVDSDGAAEAAAKALTAGDLTEFTLGGRIEEKTQAMRNSAGNFADLRSFVACPKGIPQDVISTLNHDLLAAMRAGH